MKKQYSTLFIGDVKSGYARPFDMLGSVTGFTSDKDLTGYDILAVDAAYLEPGSEAAIFGEALESGIHLALANFDERHIHALYGLTGVRPGSPSQAAIFHRAKSDGGFSTLTFNFVPFFSQQRMDCLKRRGQDPDSLLQLLIFAGLKNHLHNSFKSIPDNNLVPPYESSPFSKLNLPNWPIVEGVDGMHDLSDISVTHDTTLYLYHADADEHDTFYVIAVTGVNDGKPGGVVQYDKNHQSCDAWEDQTWTQVFNFGGALTALRPDKSAFPSGAGGVEIGESSPEKQDRAKKLVDALERGSVTIYMRVLDNGTWQPQVFLPAYSNIMDGDNVKWFEVEKYDDANKNRAGVEFSIPHSFLGGGDVKGRVKNTSEVNLEYVSVFSFDGSLVSDGKLEVVFERSAIASMTQNYVVVEGGGGGEYSNHKETDAGKVCSRYDAVIDLVALTKPGQS